MIQKGEMELFTPARRVREVERNAALLLDLPDAV
jgi:hypothetical protein